MLIPGNYFEPGCSRSLACTAELIGTRVQLHGKDGTALQCDSDYRVEPGLPGLADELIFAAGGRFIPSEAGFRWPEPGKGDAIRTLEQNKWAALGALLATPLLLWLIFTRGIPALAVYSVEWVPDKVIEQAGEQALQAIEALALEPTELDEETQKNIRNDWQQLLAPLGLDHTRYRLAFYHSEPLGANAFALVNGQVIVTDDLVTLLADHPDAINAVLLHEIGHVYHRHGLRLTAQSAASSVAFALLFGDLEGIAEVVLGSGSVLMQQHFSRDMEREADAFALSRLSRLGKPPAAFADAIDTLMDVKEENQALWARYLSSHPASEERIADALSYDK